jgi:hypothetical protein
MNHAMHSAQDRACKDQSNFFLETRAKEERCFQTMTWHADPGQERSSPPLPAASLDMSTGHNKREGHCTASKHLNISRVVSPTIACTM